LKQGTRYGFLNILSEVPHTGIPGDFDLSGIGSDFAHDDSKQGGFPGSIGAHQTDSISGIDLQPYLVENLSFNEIEGDFDGGDKTHGFLK
jgi:hypothetical protein